MRPSLGTGHVLDEGVTGAHHVVLLASLGGTIAMTAEGGQGLAPQLDSDDLASALPQLGALAEVRPLAFRRLPGAHLSLDDAIALAATLERELEGGELAGAVVTQGTDTIEEMAFALDLLLGIDKPVVVTGAMRAPSLPGADGPANLLAAVGVAAHPEARGLGVLVVMNDEIHAARHVRKLHTVSPAAFCSRPGPLGAVTEGTPRILLRPALRPAPRLAPLPAAVSVALLTAALDDGAGGGLPLVAEGVQGVVIEALGGGHMPASVLEDVKRLAARMPVVLTSRTGWGELLRDTYGFPGSERDLLRRGLIHGGSLDGPKARVLLLLLLRAGLSGNELAEAFGERA